MNRGDIRFTLAVVGLVVIVAALAVAFVVPAMYHGGDAPEVIGPRSIYLYHDPDRLVTCWVYKVGSAGGISCITDRELALR